MSGLLEMLIYKMQKSAFVFGLLAEFVEIAQRCNWKQALKSHISVQFCVS
jgi:hypothetical protein